ncbi:hypothetical protein [Pedobacter sp. SYP-B3415]|uniref:hypothetical protein n=1 Tax=Pedobacter sp. SYP-B3415 TaxID=2496641 RepID=UPI00101D4364|nr:hypothetical protein [Pedobacter sp. SYP-B3415]
MKKLLVVLLIGLGSIFSKESNAQVSVNVNIGAAPAWLPSGYNRVNYYYLPDIDTYYYVPRRQYVYMNRGHWVRSYNVPARHRGYNFHRGRKVVFHGSPYTSYRSHKVKYKTYSHPGRGHVARKHYYGRGPQKHYRSSKRYYQGGKRDHGRVYKRGPHMDRIIR